MYSTYVCQHCMLMLLSCALILAFIAAIVAMMCLYSMHWGLQRRVSFRLRQFLSSSCYDLLSGHTLYWLWQCQCIHISTPTHKYTHAVERHVCESVHIHTFQSFVEQNQVIKAISTSIHISALNSISCIVSCPPPLPLCPVHLACSSWSRSFITGGITTQSMYIQLRFIQKSPFNCIWGCKPLSRHTCSHKYTHS